jgi:hypothetical protein
MMHPSTESDQSHLLRNNSCWLKFWRGWARLGATRSASNLNQIAKAINQGTLYVDDELAAELNQACAEVAWMRVTLMQALGIKP